MVIQETVTDWQQSQDALREEVERVTALLRSVRDPAAPAVGQWNISELAMHLSQAWLAVPGLARGDLSRLYEVIPSIAGVAGDSLMREIWELEDLTMLGVRSDPERDPAVLADRIDQRADEYFAECAGLSPTDLRPWFVEGTRVPVSTLTGHLLNETLVHGYDIARADGRKWRIEPARAAMVIRHLFIPLLQELGPRTLVDVEKAAGLRATYDLRIRAGDRLHFIFGDGQLEVEKAAARKVDCHISADPVAFVMMFWGRRGQWPAIATGKLMAWGRKPWLGLRFKGLIRHP
ncbi:MAG: maleylpyruvate isomerase N-terminal domain-containing protein [Actinobacteria bacterium]|nr:maleylpyruvate isomerase N-terminal domain-containing protein [Actinomycetota bacterium]